MTARLGLRLVYEELDLLDLALQGGGFVRQAGSEIGCRGDIPVGRRFRRARDCGAGFRGDLNPPAS
jgi:hypothetical protein